MEAKDREAIARVCPQWENAWMCRHCEDPKCVKVCPRDAFYEVSDGIWAVDPEKCDGCGKCVEACPYGAIKIVNGVARKCDLCLSRSSTPLCIAHVKIVYTREELEEIGRNVGWRILEEGEYRVNFPRIGLFESRVVKRVMEIYQKFRGEFSWEEILEDVAEELEIDERSFKEILQVLEITYRKHGPLELLKDSNIEEIAIVDIGKPVFVYIREKGWKQTNIAFCTDEYLTTIVNRIAERLGRRITRKDPRVNAVLPDGSRLHVIFPPLSRSHSVTIRRFHVRPFTPADLVRLGTASPRQLAIVWLALEREKNVVIGGNTGSGKTTTLNAIFAFVPLKERIIIVEEVPEINLPHEHVVRLIPGGMVGMEELVKDTLRMRPDRVIVGEVRRPNEFHALFDTMLAGQGRGSYATMHARSVEEAKRRIVDMGVPESDLLALDLLVIQKRWKEGNREMRRIMEMGNPLGKTIAEALEMDADVFEKEVSEMENFIRKTKIYDVKSYAEAVERWRSKKG